MEDKACLASLASWSRTGRCCLLIKYQQEDALENYYLPFDGIGLIIVHFDAPTAPLLANFADRQGFLLGRHYLRAKNSTQMVAVFNMELSMAFRPRTGFWPLK